MDISSINFSEGPKGPQRRQPSLAELNFYYSIWDKQKAEIREQYEQDLAEKNEWEYKHKNVHNEEFDTTIEASKSDKKTTAYKMVEKGKEAEMSDKLGKASGDPYQSDDGKTIQNYKKGQVITYTNEEGQQVKEFIFKDNSKAIFTQLCAREYLPEKVVTAGNGTITQATYNYGDQYLTTIQTQIYNNEGTLILSRTGDHPDERCPR